jgi:hypothetical protein
MIKNGYWSSCKVPLFSLDCMKHEFSQQIFEEYSNIKFHGNLPSGSRVIVRGRTDGWTDMMKFIVAFRNSANAPKNFHITASHGWSFSKKTDKCDILPLEALYWQLKKESLDRTLWRIRFGRGCGSVLKRD